MIHGAGLLEPKLGSAEIVIKVFLTSGFQLGWEIVVSTAVAKRDIDVTAARAAMFSYIRRCCTTMNDWSSLHGGHGLSLLVLHLTV